MKRMSNQKLEQYALGPANTKKEMEFAQELLLARKVVAAAKPLIPENHPWDMFEQSLHHALKAYDSRDKTDET